MKQEERSCSQLRRTRSLGASARPASSAHHSFGYGHAPSHSSAEDSDTRRHLVQICFDDDDVNVDDHCSLRDVSLNVHVPLSCTVQNLLDTLHALMPSIRSCDALRLEHRQCESQDANTLLSESSPLCEVLRPGDVVLPGRKVKARSRSDSHRGEESIVSRKHEVEPTQAVTFHGFPETSCFRSLNGAVFERSEVLNGKPAFSLVYMNQEYLLCSYPSTDGGSDSTWRIGLASDMRKQEPNAIAYAPADESISWPSQVQSGWSLLDPKSREFAPAEDVRCIDVQQASRHDDASASGSARNRQVRTPSQSVCRSAHGGGVELQLGSPSHAISRLDTEPRTRREPHDMYPNMDVAVRGLVRMNVPMRVPVFVDLQGLERRMLREPYLHRRLA